MIADLIDILLRRHLSHGIEYINAVWGSIRWQGMDRFLITVKDWDLYRTQNPV